jgi:hypothetical protein
MSNLSTRVGETFVSLETLTMEGTVMFADGCKATTHNYPVGQASKVVVSPFGACCYNHRSTHEQMFDGSEVVGVLNLMGIVALNY